MSLATGTRLGQYEIVRLLGEGGMGEVWLARDLDLERPIALKLLPAEVTADPKRVRRFEQEARAASALNHPNVCTIYALGRTTDGRHFIAMEYVEGQTLREKLGHGTLKRKELLDIASQVASALSAAHIAGVAHRDIKPENVILRPDGFVKVLDFGLAKLMAIDSAPEMTTKTLVRTEPGAAVGTVSYMSPEQARAESVDARTDIWSLGVMLYELVAGTRPFTGPSTSEVLAAILDHEPAPLARFDREVPEELQRIVTKALKKDPQQRYQSMKEMLLDLQALREQTSDASGRRFPVVPLARHPKSRLVGAAAIVLFLAVLSWIWADRSSLPDAAGRGGAQRDYPLTRVTFGSGLQTDPSFSPDGRFIAYASDRAGNFDIWVLPVGGGGDPVQITKSPDADIQPAWSPDGKAIVFRSERDGGGLFVMPALGGPERRLTTFGSAPEWSRDGSSVLFREGALLLSRDFSSYRRLYSVPADGGVPQELAADFLRNGSWFWFAGHPDGRISALGEHPTRGLGFFTVSRDGREVVTSRQVPLGAEPAATPSRFGWNAAGTMLFVQATANALRTLWRVRIDPATLDWQSAERLTAGTTHDVAAAISIDGTRLAFSRQQESTRAWALPIATSPRPRVTGEGVPLTEDGALIESPALSPDDRTLAYHLRRPGIDRTELWAVAMNGTSRELLATNAVHLAWSRDSTRVAYLYVRLNRQPMESALAYRRLGGAEQFVSPWTSDWAIHPYDWTPDGRSLLGTLQIRKSLQTSLVLWPTSSPKATHPERILLQGVGVEKGEDPHGQESYWQGRFSPNGKWISFVALNAPHRVRLGVIPASASSQGKWSLVAADHNWADKPRWAADGRALFFISRGPTSYLNLWAVPFDPEAGQPAGAPVQLTAFDSPALIVSPYGVFNELSISAKHAVLPMLTITGNIWMLERVDK